MTDNYSFLTFPPASGWWPFIQITVDGFTTGPTTTEKRPTLLKKQLDVQWGNIDVDLKRKKVCYFSYVNVTCIFPLYVDDTRLWFI